MSLNLALFSKVIIGLALTPTATKSCVVPTGIDFGDEPCHSSLCVELEKFQNLGKGSILLQVIDAVNAPRPGLVEGVESPVQNHWVASNIGQVYSAMSSFEDVALELWGRKDVSERRRRCKNSVSDDQFQWHRRVTLFYTCVYVFSSVHTWKKPIGGAEVPLRELAKKLGVDFDICDLDRRRADDKIKNCEDISTPWGLAIHLKEEILDWMARDGWNKDGKLSGAKNNLVPYRDWRSKPNRYRPVNDPWKLEKPQRWQPLLENNGQGFHYQQEHVTPHIGESGVSLYLRDDQICKLTDTLSLPNYDLDAEAKMTLERGRLLNDRKKARVEIFNNKLTSLLPLLGQLYAKRGVSADSFEFITVDAANIIAIKEATILAWRAKVKFDLVRPTSYVHEKFGDTVVETYGGPKIKGSAKIKASDWHPYKRVMPHSEFPSGSACICQAFADAVIFFTEEDDFINPKSLELMRPANSSEVEKGKPERDQKFQFTSWSQMVKECSISRLEGGMHFTGAIDAGRKMCSTVGREVARAVHSLSHGKMPQFVANFKHNGPSEVRNCTVPHIGDDSIDG